MANNSSQVKFIDTSHEVKVTMVKLSKSALRSAGRIVAKNIKERTRFKTTNLKNHVGFWAKIDKKTGQPELQVGYYSWQRVRKAGKTPSRANPMWFEFGVNPHIIKVAEAKTLTDGKIDYGKSVHHPGLRDEHVLRNSAFDNIDQIQAAQEKYLAELNKLIEEVGGKIEESEEAEYA